MSLGIINVSSRKIQLRVVMCPESSLRAEFGLITAILEPSISYRRTAICT